MSALLLLGLAGLAAYLAGQQSDNLEGGWRIAPVLPAIAVAVAMGTAWVFRVVEVARVRVWRRALLALVAAFGAWAAAGGVVVVVALAGLMGLAAAPEVALIGRVLSDRRTLGHRFVYPRGWARGWSVAALLLFPLVIVGATVLGPVRGALLAGLVAASWTLAVSPRVRSLSIRGRAICTLGAVPAAVLAAVTGSIALLVVALVAAAALGWLARSGPSGFAACGVAACFAAAGVVIADAPPVRLFTLIRTNRLEGSEGPMVFVRHRKTGAHQVLLSRMKLFTSNSDSHFAEDLVHPAMSVATRRARILVVGADCSGIFRELGKYSGVKSVDRIELYPGADRACRSLPSIARALGPGHTGRRLAGLEAGLKALAREGARYDVAFVMGADPPRLPSALHSGSFYESLRGLLAPTGVLAARLGSFHARPPMQCALSRMRERFPNVLPYHVFAADPAGAIRHLLALATPEPISAARVVFRVPLRTGSAAIFRAATHFPTQVQFRGVPEPAGGCAAYYRSSGP